MERPGFGTLKQWVGRHRKRLIQVGGGAATLWAVVFVFNLTKPLPEGVSVAGLLRDASGMEFLYDLTYQDGGRTVVEQRIFDRVLSMIDSADEFVVIDMFLFNGLHGGEREYRHISAEMVDHIVARKRARPGLVATLITDEINNFYGAYTSAEIAGLQAAGVQVVTTRMMRLRDSNPAYSAAWRMFAGWFGTGGPGWIPNRQVARELVTSSDGRIQVRWYDTHGEQFHTKLVMVKTADSVVVMGGSANLTRRNIEDYNLEADLRFILPG
jgi:hypothetical protein